MMWTPICKPVRDEVTGRAGMAVYLMCVGADGDTLGELHEVGRAAFVRQGAANPDQSFQDALDIIIQRADAAAEAANDLMAELERQQQIEAEERERERLLVLNAAIARITDVLSTHGKEKGAMN